MALFSISQFFFFQAEDGIRDYKVTGVQTCALPIYGSEIGLAQGHFGNGLEGELEPRRIARGAQGTGRIVLEGALVEDAEQARLEVGAAVVGVEQLATGERVRNRVDAEIAPSEVVRDPGGTDVRQRSGALVRLGAGPGQVEGEATGL